MIFVYVFLLLKLKFIFVFCCYTLLTLIIVRTFIKIRTSTLHFAVVCRKTLVRFDGIV